MKYIINFIVFANILFFLSFCGYERKNSCNSIANWDDTFFICKDTEPVFRDSNWFHSYLNILDRDESRHVFEKWELFINDSCSTSLILYSDSTYIEKSCEIDYWTSGGFFVYCEDTLYCVEITPKHELDAAKNVNYVRQLYTYIKHSDKLEFVSRKEQITYDKFQEFYSNDRPYFTKTIP